MKSFLAELKRRNVYKVAVAYVVVAWLLIQIATQVFPFFAVPNWAVRLVVLLLILGFPVALVFSWAFEITLEGIKRESEVAPDKSITRGTGRKIAAFTAIAAVLAVGLMMVHLLRPKTSLGARPGTGTAATDIPQKSIAVLPFENLSDDKANGYFTDGIQDEILTRLAKIADLKVISRTSTQHYKSTPENVPEIARQLGVAHILEGSVQKSADAVRVNVQLIKAATDSHLWADSFDRKLTDVFAVESEVAKAIANQLQAKITGREAVVLAEKPTTNPEAYDNYLRGLAYDLKSANSTVNSREAQKYLKEAVRLDPKFALAWTLLSFIDAHAYLTQTLQPTIQLREEAKQAAATALALEPDLAEAVQAQGYYHYACLKEYDTAVSYFERARTLLPNSSRIPELLAYVARRQGRWEQSNAYLEEAERLDPRNIRVLSQYARSYAALRRFADASHLVDRILEIIPDDMDTLALAAAIAQAQGDLPRAARLLAPLRPSEGDPNVIYTQVYQTILERQPAPSITRLQKMLAHPDPNRGYDMGELRYWLGWAQEVAGQQAEARESWRTGRAELEPILKQQPDNYFTMIELALTETGLGNKASALDLAQRAIAVMPVDRDAFQGPGMLEALARVKAQVGEPDQAIALLQKLLAIPYEGPLNGEQMPLTRAMLKLDPLRDDARFQELLKLTR